MNPSPASVSPRYGWCWRAAGGGIWGHSAVLRWPSPAGRGGQAQPRPYRGQTALRGGGCRHAVFAEDKVYSTGRGWAGSAAPPALAPATLAPQLPPVVGLGGPGCCRDQESHGDRGSRGATGLWEPDAAQGPGDHRDQGGHRDRRAMGAGHPPAPGCHSAPPALECRLRFHPLGTPSSGYPHPLGSTVPWLSPSLGYHHAIGTTISWVPSPPG